jgi:hypothetical protein
MSHRAWLPAIVFGVGYVLIGRLFPQPADNLRAWRLAAWVASGAVFAAHIGYEQFGVRSSARMMASRTALAVALGGFGLALAGMIHSMRIDATIRPSWLLALIAWPMVTAVPAFVAALVAGVLLTRLTHRTS